MVAGDASAVRAGPPRAAARWADSLSSLVSCVSVSRRRASSRVPLCRSDVGLARRARVSGVRESPKYAWFVNTITDVSGSTAVYTSPDTTWSGGPPNTPAHRGTADTRVGTFCRRRARHMPVGARSGAPRHMLPRHALKRSARTAPRGQVRSGRGAGGRPAAPPLLAIAPSLQDGARRARDTRPQVGALLGDRAGDGGALHVALGIHDHRLFCQPNHRVTKLRWAGKISSNIAHNATHAREERTNTNPREHGGDETSFALRAGGGRRRYNSHRVGRRNQSRCRGWGVGVRFD